MVIWALAMRDTIKPWQGYSFLIFSQIMSGISIVGIKALLNVLSTAEILLIRFFITFALLLTMHFFSGSQTVMPLKRLKAVDMFYLVIQALCAGLLFNILLFWGMQYTSASIAGIITSTLPAVVVVFSIVFLKEHLKWNTALCLVCAVIGLITINVHNIHIAGSRDLFGSIIIMLSLVPEAYYYILAKRNSNKLPVFMMAALMNLINIPFTCLFFMIMHLHHPGELNHVHIYQWALLVLISVTSSLFYVCWFLGIKHVPASKAGLTTALMPISTLALAYIFLHETITIIQFIGMLLVIASILICSSSTRCALKNTINK